MPMNTINASVLSGTTTIEAMGHSFLVPAYTEVPGKPIGIRVESHELERVQPWYAQALGLYSSAFGLIIAEKKHGKSALMKIIAMNLMLGTAELDWTRLAIDDFKPEDKDSEYEAITTLTNSRRYQVATGEINPFERRLFTNKDKNGKEGKPYEAGLLGVAELFTDFANGGVHLIGDYGSALRVGLYTMLQMHESMWLPGTLRTVCMDLQDYQIHAYYASLDVKLRHQLLQRIEKLPPKSPARVWAEINLNQLMNASHNYNVADIKAAGVYVAQLLEDIFEGTYASMFGTNSLYDIITQRVVTYDWRNMPNVAAETLGRTLLTSIEVNSIESNRLDLVPHLRLNDEKHKYMTNLQYALWNELLSEIARGLHICDLSATHTLNSIRKGDVGSALYNAAETIINNLGFVFIGKQPDDPRVLDELQQRYRLPRRMRDMLPIMRPQEFVYVPGESDPARLVHVVAAPSIMPYIKTGAAVERMIRGIDLDDEFELKAFARRNGLVYLGKNHS